MRRRIRRSAETIPTLYGHHQTTDGPASRLPVLYRIGEAPVTSVTASANKPGHKDVKFATAPRRSKGTSDEHARSRQSRRQTAPPAGDAGCRLQPFRRRSARDDREPRCLADQFDGGREPAIGQRPPDNTIVPALRPLEPCRESLQRDLSCRSWSRRCRCLRSRSPGLRDRGPRRSGHSRYDHPAC